MFQRETSVHENFHLIMWKNCTVAGIPSSKCNVARNKGGQE